MDRITQALEWAEKRMAGWEPFTKNQMEILHFAFHELKHLHKPVVVWGGASETKNVHRHKNDLKWDDCLDTQNTPTEPLLREGEETEGKSSAPEGY